MSQSLYNEQNGQDPERLFTMSVLTEDKSGLLNHITIIFSRRKINISSLNVSTTEVAGVSRFTIVVHSTREQAEKVVKQIRKLVDVLGAFLYEEDQVHYQEIALYKVPTKIFMGGNKIEKLVRDNGARILVIEEDYIVLEKTGHKDETSDLFKKLEPYGVLEFVRSGRVAISMSKRKTETFIKELEEIKTNLLLQ
ncbi:MULTISPECIES: acetolactate synthase small subunit [Imperialibacter]|uniref:Acetolactate synthase small subunit n=1 Tax=Imperialibacter roseus TaxID=1324217 RepID=A0ABZ0ILA1_9BACT|nr:MULTISPECIES: acetolactate synthase small subunit [Imperialibacter]WOK04551.1 acetolactate synthase small subunit [Imperialibacter roseus]CAD5277770.1 Acetolactate synthase small subunit [Imperialibacter sp. 89]CAD5292080.1 Acetolactate synthase small subunit [Imperialibacter sp. 75]VVT00171.1 Acetolactate synthase small subunit [Imperialibacter sp. EC-SDR9]|tara:strand:+ start:2721 stop:3305 length:585 start_codon:yes stop_codon:yes gene_type:complete